MRGVLVASAMTLTHAHVQDEQTSVFNCCRQKMQACQGESGGRVPEHHAHGLLPKAELKGLGSVVEVEAGPETVSSHSLDQSV